MADFNAIINSIESENTTKSEQVQNSENEVIINNDEKIYDDEKINISELFDAELISDLFNNILDFLITGGLLVYAKKQNVNITRSELSLNESAKQKNKDTLNKVVEKIKIPSKLVGTILIIAAILMQYYPAIKQINSRAKEKPKKPPKIEPKEEKTFKIKPPPPPPAKEKIILKDIINSKEFKDLTEQNNINNEIKRTIEKKRGRGRPRKNEKTE